MTATTLDRPDADTRRLLHPSREQLRVAAAMFRVATEDVTAVVVPVVSSREGAGPVPVQGGARRDSDRLEHPGGYWLADRGSRDGAYGYPAARESARAAAEAHLRRRGVGGVPGWVTIRPDGSWAACDGA